MDKFMNIAIEEAKLAYDEGNVPVGAVIVKDNTIVSSNHNKKNTSKISIYHAEMLCIIDACEKLNSWYLNDCVMYVTLKPCKMCEAAIAESRLNSVYYLLESNYCDNLNSNINNISYNKIDMVNNSYYSNLLSDFFKNVRNL